MPEYELQEPAPSEAREDIAEDSVFPAELISIKEETKVNKAGEEYTRLNWRFRITDDQSDFDGRSVYGETSTAFTRHADCKFYAWSQMVLSVEFPPGFKIDTDLLLNQMCRIVVGAREYTNKEGVPSIYNFVSDVMPLTKMAEPAF